MTISTFPLHLYVLVLWDVALCVIPDDQIWFWQNSICIPDAINHSYANIFYGPQQVFVSNEIPRGRERYCFYFLFTFTSRRHYCWFLWCLGKDGQGRQHQLWKKTQISKLIHEKSVQNYLKEKERTCCTNPGQTGYPLHLGWSSNGSRHVGSAQEMPIRCENENIFWSLEDVKALTWFTLLSGNLVSPGSATLTWTSPCSRSVWLLAKPSSRKL